MAKKRIDAGILVGSSAVNHNRPLLERLSARDREYFREVARELREAPEASPYIVARRLMEVLNFKAAESTVVRTLKRLRDEP